MSKADRIAKNHRIQQQRDSAESTKVTQRSKQDRQRMLTDEAKLLLPRLVELCKRYEMDKLLSFRVVRKHGGRMFPKDRAGWPVGQVIGGLGHGEMGPIAIYVITTGELLYGAKPGTLTEPESLSFFEEPDGRFEELVEMLRQRVARLEQSHAEAP